MEGASVLPSRDALASLIGWWREAGVDTLVEDTPRSWLTAHTPFPAAEDKSALAGRREESGSLSRPVPREARVPSPTGETVSEALPPTLPELLTWMRESPDVPEARWGRTRLLPAGNPQADLMILTDMPEPGDAEAGQLLSGEVGALFDKMLAAISRSRASIWLAPIATARAIGRIPAAALPRLTAIAGHQIALVAPKRLLIMGKTPNELLIGPDWQERRGALQTLNLAGLTIHAVATFHPRLLHERPAYKAQAWKDLQLLIKGL